MEAWVDFYHVLEVNESSDRASIEAKYRSLCKRYHPDLNPSPEAEGLMKEINLAWEVLKDDQKRRIYDAEWKRRASPARTTETRGAWDARYSAQTQTAQVAKERARATTRTETAQEVDERAARKAISGYFDGIMRGKYKETYELLCEEDRQNIPLESFIEWQTSVGGTYHIESFTIIGSKDIKKFPVNEKNYTAKRMMLEITERNVSTGEYSCYRMSKFSLCQGSKWRIYLGYRNLDNVMTQFSILAGTAGETIRRATDLSTGLPNRRGFLEKCKAEAYRYERYGRLCAMCVVTVDPIRELGDDVRDKIIVQTGCSLYAALRLIDLIGTLGDGRFAVLLSEANHTQAKNAARRITRRVEQEVLACFDSKIQFKWKIKPYRGGEMEEILKLCEK